MTREEYIQTYKDDAVKEMLQHGVPASITLAQGILESGNGNSPLAKYANNHFGIKCHKEWDGPTFIQDDDAKNECFRKYKTVLESYSDHSLFIKNRKWYTQLFELKTTDYKGWAYGLKKAGYATEPKYAEMLIDLIEKNKLYELDKISTIQNYTASSSPTKITPEFKALKHNVNLINKRKCVYLNHGDSFKNISKEFDVEIIYLKKYNDWNEEFSLKEGDIIYLQPKRKKAQEEFHVVKAGETLHSISQKYGIKQKKLEDRNLMDANSKLFPGDKIQLNSTK
ncbi:MAG: glucosaminidase domain-containing protein [Bacteroidota bacterium]